MKRRPHQQIYKPGSGTLKKSNSGVEDNDSDMKRRTQQSYSYRPFQKSNTGLEVNESDTNLIIDSKQNPTKNTPQFDDNFKSEGNFPRNRLQNLDHTVDKLGDMSIKDEPRRSKKPDLELYVPKSVAQSRKIEHEVGRSQVSKRREEWSQNQETIGDSTRSNIFSNGNDNRYENQNSDQYNSNKSKRYSNKRRGNDKRDIRDSNDDWGDKNNQNRQMRQGSEPRGVNSTNRDSHHNWQRSRDTRSVEPNSGPNSSYGEKSYSKPPSGRRHSTIGLDRLNELPPRFRKKMMEQGKINLNLPEESWDGTSGPSTHYPRTDNNQSNSYATLPNPYFPQNPDIPPSNTGYSTLPGRSRGRGRFTNDHIDRQFVGGGGFETRSPCNSRPPTPPMYDNNSYRDAENSGRPTSRPQTPSSFHRRNDYNRYSNDKFHSNSRHSSQERYKRNNYKDDSYEVRSNDRFSQRKNDDHRNRDEYFSHNREEHRVRRRDDDYGRGNRDEHRVQSRPKDVQRNTPENKNPSPQNLPEPQKTETRPEQDAQLSLPVSPDTPSGDSFKSCLDPIPNILDWSEEVELNDRLKAEALSDNLTRSSSVASVHEYDKNQFPSKIERSSNGNRKHRKSGRKNKRRGRSRSGTRERSYDRNNTFDNFKVPLEPRHRRPSDRRDSSFDRFSRSSKSHSRDCSFDRMRSSTGEHGNWREEIKHREEFEKGRDPVRSKNNSESSDFGRMRKNSEDNQETRQLPNNLLNIDVKKAGVLVIPQPRTRESGNFSGPPSLDHPKIGDARKQTNTAKSLFDHNNPNKPIIVKTSNARAAPGIPDNKEITPPPAVYDQYGNICPNWYREDSEEYQKSHYPNMIKDVIRADQEIQYAIHEGIFLNNWSGVETFRQFLREALQYFLCKDLKFSQSGNIENHFWKLLYYNIIERIRKAILDDETNKEHYKKFVLYLVDEGTQYFEQLLKMLEETYQFDLNQFLGANQSIPQRGLGFVGLALVSAQKIFIFLGDLARYKEQINETNNFGKCRQWYIKAHEINPKNGRPYKQLAVLAVCARRKLDAVYYYMRSLMSTNPIHSASEKLTSLFYENSKKYEQGEKKRREERLERVRQQMKEKESETSNVPTSIRRETWIRPDGGKRVYRTTQAVQEEDDSEDENLSSLSSVEVNKRFVISYLHVHGKLITRIGMESFQEAAMQMLKEFRALLQHSPLPLPSNRLLQLLALNMFAIESTQLKDPLQQLSGYRSEHQEKALVMSLQMFNLILERCVSILEEHLATKPEHLNAVSMDAQILLPPIKIWCDWMLCHSGVWNPPPSIQEYNVGTPGDTWTRLAKLINLLEQFDQSASAVFKSEQLEGYTQLRLPEDNVLSGFTPLMVNVDQPIYIPQNYDAESAQFVLRLNKLLFFGTEFLCGLEPPVLKLEIYNDTREYISVVSTSNSRDSPQSEEIRINNEVLTESFSEDEEEAIKSDSLSEDTSSEVRDLLNRKVELEKRHKKHQLHMERVKKILSQSVISVHIDISPKYLVPDTNCFIDHLDRIASIIKSANSPYTIMVPIVVLGELEGLAKGGKLPIPGSRSFLNPEHVKRVGESARKALNFLKKRQPNLKCVTTKGAIISSTTFTTEDDATSNGVAKNDDKILMTCLNLSKIHTKEQTSAEEGPRQLSREVVLLTDDRNLRVKALTSDVPVRELPDFMKWAGLG